MAGQKNAKMDDYAWLTLLSIDTALRESYRKLSLSVRVPYKFLKPEDLAFTGLIEFLSTLLKENKNIRYQGHGILVLPKQGGLGKVVLCDELLGEYFGLPAHLFASTAWRRGLLARYVAAILLADTLGFSGFSGDGRKKRKTALGIMHATSPNHYAHFSHSKFMHGMKKTVSLKCDRILSDFRELGITDTDLLYALEKTPGPLEETTLALQNEISETETLLWLLEKKKNTPLSGKTALQMGLHANFLKTVLAALLKIKRRRIWWNPDQDFELKSPVSYHKAMQNLAERERIPTGNLISFLEGLQPYKRQIMMAVI